MVGEPEICRSSRVLKIHSCVVANGSVYETELRNGVLPVNMNGLRFAVTEIVLSCLHSQSNV